MGPITKWSLIVLGAILVSFISVAATLTHEFFQPKFKPTPLTADMHGKWDEVDKEFDARVRSKFPLGSSEATMIMQLRKADFVRQDWNYQVATGQEAEAVRREDNVVCNQAAYVYWRADNSGKLTSVRGSYRMEGCL